MMMLILNLIASIFAIVKMNTINNTAHEIASNWLN
tara:strand:- start:31618 stop:31722 length:105 start_codon:yes stop_codon:yes gene_type:complete